MDRQNQLVLPTIHLNGTSREILVEGYAAAHNQIMQAIEAFREAAPNSRDYYPQGERAFTVAVERYRDNLRALEKVRDDLSALYEHVAG